VFEREIKEETDDYLIGTYTSEDKDTYVKEKLIGDDADVNTATGAKEIHRCRKIETPKEIRLKGKSRKIEDELLLTFDQGSSTFDYGSVPDTGSSLGVMAFNIAKKNKIKYDTEVEVNLKNASGKYMDVVGLATIWSKPKYINGKLNKYDKRRIQSKYVVTRDMHNEILVSRDDLKRFGVIPVCFPRVEVLQTKVESEIETEMEKPKEYAKSTYLLIIKINICFLP
jgi:hypothetical protein